MLELNNIEKIKFKNKSFKKYITIFKRLVFIKFYDIIYNSE